MITFKVVKPYEDYSEAFNIRRTVFVDEQRFPFENEIDLYDPKSFHVILYADKIAIACGRVYIRNKIAKIGRVAVLKKWRKNGYATKVCQELICIAIKNNVQLVILHSQTYIISLYEKLGFVSIGVEFIEEGIPHICMEMHVGNT